MRVLWFTDTPSLYRKSLTTYNGSGWTESLEFIIREKKEIDLGVCFFHNDDCFKVIENGTTYYPVPLYNTPLKRLKHNLHYSKSDEIEVTYYLKVVEDFKPDIIHVFGSEKSYGLLSYYTNIPLVIHIQGILNPYLNAYFVPNNSKLDLAKYLLIKPIKLFNSLKVSHFFSINAKREIKIISNCKHFIGRTDWDKSVNLLFSPDAKYYYCSEVLRSSFNADFKWTFPANNKVKIVSTLSKVPYKGFDLILKTAKLLKENFMIEFEWFVFGVGNYEYWEKKIGYNFNSVNVFLKGNTSPDDLIRNYIDANFYVHPSYIDNSPNSVCEAQIIGLPVIATYVGGVPSLISSNVNGVLVPANDPHYLASKIIQLYNNKGLCEFLSQNARKDALYRHNGDNIYDDLFSIYNSIVLGN